MVVVISHRFHNSKGGVFVKKAKKILSWCLAGCLALGMMPGCAQNQQSETSSTTVKDVTITFMRQKDTTNSVTKCVSAFEKAYPHIKVKLLSMPASSDALHNTLVTALAAGDSSFDVMAMDSVWTQEFLDAGWVESVDSAFTQSERSKYLSSTLNSVTYNGKVYAYPYFTDCGLLYYRKDIITTPPKTWDELIQMSKANIGKNGIKYGYVMQGAQYEGFVCNVMEFIHGNGGDVLTNGKVSINTSNVINGLQDMKNVLSSGITPAGVNTYKEVDCAQLFTQGETLFMRDVPKYLSVVNADTSKVKGKVGICELPRGNDGTHGVGNLGGYNMGININSNNKEAALTFVQYMTGEAGQKVNALQGGYCPTRSSLYKDEEILAKYPDWEKFESIFADGVPRPLTPKYSKMSDSMQINFNKAVNGLLPIKTAVENVEKDLKSILNQN
jgi:multiple sugar transport system substrate-binding protein